jgi:hypothetical protein
MKKSKKAGGKPARKTQPEDDVVDTAFAETARPLSAESLGDAERFEPDTGRQPLASGGVKRGEALQVAEEEDDFEDGRSSGGRTSRSQEDQWARGDVGSRATETPSGYLSVDGREGDLPRPVEPKSVELPQRRRVTRRSASRRVKPPKTYQPNA